MISGGFVVFVGIAEHTRRHCRQAGAGGLPLSRRFALPVVRRLSRPGAHAWVAAVPSGGRFGAEVDHFVRAVAVRLDGGRTASAQGYGLALPWHGFPGGRDDIEVAADQDRAVGADDK
jgi:hypothetical protein